MRYEDRIVCFLDVLGFADHIRSTLRKDGTDDEKRIATLADAFESIRWALDADKPSSEGKVVTQFSDSIVISFPAKAQSGVFLSLQSLLWVHINLIERGLLCR